MNQIPNNTLSNLERQIACLKRTEATLKVEMGKEKFAEMSSLYRSMVTQPDLYPSLIKDFLDYQDQLLQLEQFEMDRKADLNKTAESFAWKMKELSTR